MANKQPDLEVHLKEERRSGDSESIPSSSEPERKRLVSYIRKCIEDEPFFMQFRHLQRLNLTRIQNDLAKSKSRILSAESPSNDDDLKILTETLHDYGK
jgi:hypothetical protein